MKFGPLPLPHALGEILAHNISDADGRRVLRKGQTLDHDALRTLEDLGHSEVFVARLEPGDVHEDEAAGRIAHLLRGAGMKVSTPRTGRVNLTAACMGVVRIDLLRLDVLNETPGVTVATVRAHSFAEKGARVATVKIIPYALPHAALRTIETETGAGPALRIDEIHPTAVSVVLVGGTGARAKMAEGLGDAIRRRIHAMGCEVAGIEHVALDEEALAESLRSRVDATPALVVVAGETAIMDLDDLIPRGLRRAGGRVEELGLAMDPGQLLLLGYLGPTPVVGAPGCVRGTASDGFDAVVPRLLAGERLDRKDLHALAHGGLLPNPRAR